MKTSHDWPHARHRARLHPSWGQQSGSQAANGLDQLRGVRLAGFWVRVARKPWPQERLADQAATVGGRGGEWSASFARPPRANDRRLHRRFGSVAAESFTGLLVLFVAELALVMALTELLERLDLLAVA